MKIFYISCGSKLVAVRSNYRVWWCICGDCHFGWGTGESGITEYYQHKFKGDSNPLAWNKVPNGCLLVVREQAI